MLLLLKADPGRPTPAQSAAGNYKKPRVHWRGLEIAIENPAGTVREGRGWRTKMVNDYGYVCRTEGVDGDEVDVYLGPELETAPTVYVVHQRRKGAADAKAWTDYDEDKVMAGFPSEAAARAAYLRHYDDERFLGPITAMPVDEFVAKVRATREKPAMIKGQDFGTMTILKSRVGPYVRAGRVVNLRGYDSGQAELFERPKSTMSAENPYKDKHPILDTPDLFTGNTGRDEGLTEQDVEARERALLEYEKEMRRAAG